MKKVLTAVSLMVMAISLTFAGGGRQQSATSGGAVATSTGPDAWKEKYTTPVTLTFGRDGTNYEWKNGEYFDNSVYSRYIKDTLNIDVKMAWVANDQDLTQRITLAIASNDLPDVMMLRTYPGIRPG